jgi:hypothetical protein
MSGEALGEAVLAVALDEARSLWGERLLAAYVLGSLAHGGFSQLVSDVDFGVVLEGPLQHADSDVAASLGERVAGQGPALGDRLSVFWGSQATLAGDRTAGRFPPVDLADLIQYGRLLFGRDIRGGLRPPTHQELVVQAAEGGLGLLRRPSYREALARPASLLNGDPKPLTKAVLFPVRFMYTARTGEIGRNQEAARHFASAEAGPMGELAAAAFRWREEPPSPDDATAGRLLEGGLVPIYELFLEDHASRAASYGLGELAGRLRQEAAALPRR